MSKKSGSAPSAPDPQVTIAAQTAANSQAAKDTVKYSAMDRYGPAGSTVYTRDGEGVPTSQRTTLTRDGQHTFNNQQRISANLSDVGAQRVQGLPVTPFSLAGQKYDPNSVDISSMPTFGVSSYGRGNAGGVGGRGGQGGGWGGGYGGQEQEGFRSPYAANNATPGGTGAGAGAGSNSGQLSSTGQGFDEAGGGYGDNAGGNVQQANINVGGSQPAAPAAAAQQPAVPQYLYSTMGGNSGFDGFAGEPETTQTLNPAWTAQQVAQQAAPAQSGFSVMGTPLQSGGAANGLSSTGMGFDESGGQQLASTQGGFTSMGADMGAFDPAAVSGAAGAQAQQGQVQTQVQPFSPMGAQQMPPEMGQGGNGQGGQGGFDQEAMPYDPRSYGNMNYFQNQVGDATYRAGAANLDPQWQNQQREMEQSLANRGIPIGSEAYNRTMSEFSRNKSNAYSQLQNQSTMASLNNTQGIVGLEQGLRTNAWQQNLQATQQKQADWSKQLDIGQKLRGSSVNEMLQQRNQGINEIAALLQGSPALAMPGAVNTPVYQMAPANIAGIEGNAFNMKMAQYDQQNKERAGVWNGALGVASLFM